MNGIWRIVFIVAWAVTWCAVAVYWKARTRELERRLRLIARMRRNDL